MRQLETQPLGGFNDTTIDTPAVFEVTTGNRSILYRTLIENTPAITSTYDGYTSPQLTVESGHNNTQWDEQRYYPVGRLAGFHGRNIEVLADSIKIVDRFGNEYFSLGIKGCDFSNPHLQTSPTAERDFIIHGFQESIVMERVLRASQVLRENGIDTEYICGLTLPEQFPLDRQGDGSIEKDLVDLPDLLDYVCTEYAKEHHESVGSDPLTLKTSLLEKLHDCDYLISYRAMDSPYRFGELYRPELFEKFIQFFKTLDLDPDERKQIETLDIHKYITNLFGPIFGGNLGAMHKIGVVHKFLHSYNLTALGSIVDLDSCKGEILGLGDAQPSEEDYIKDVVTGLKSITEVAYALPEITSDSMLDRGRITDTVYWGSMHYLFSYVEKRFEDNFQEKVHFLANLLIEANNSDEVFSDPRQRLSLTRQILGAYLLLSPPAEDQKIDSTILSFDMTETLKEEGHSCSFLYALPPRYFTAMQQLMLDNNWTVEKQALQEGEATDRIIKHPLQADIEAVFLEILTRKYRGDKKIEIDDPEAFLYTIGTAIGYIETPTDSGGPEETVEKSFQHHLEQITEHFKSHRFPSLIEDHGTNQRWDSSIGAVRIGRPAGEHENTWMPITYFDTDEDYAEFLIKHNVHHLPVKLGSQKIIDQIQDDPNAALLIADASHLVALSENISNTQMNTMLFQGTGPDTIKPLLALYNYSSEEPTIYVFKRDQYSDEDTPDYSLEKLFHELCPSLYPQPRDRLFTDKQTSLQP